MRDQVRYKTSVNRFTIEQPIRFSHCDPAAITFFPNYYRLINDLVEDWFDQVLCIGYADFIQRRRFGLPTVAIQTEFLSSGKFGARLQLGLSVLKIGRSSFQLAVEGESEGEVLLRSIHTIVVTSLQTGSSAPIPDDLRSAMHSFQQA